MASTGVLVDETLSISASARGQAASKVLGVFGSRPGVHTESTGVDSYRITRRFRPTWAIVLAVVTAPTVIGLAFLLVRSTETCALSLSTRDGEPALDLRGRLERSALDALKAALASPTGQEWAPRPGPTFVAGSVALPPAVGAPSFGPVAEPLAQTLPKPDAGPLPAWSLLFDDGRSERVGEFMLIGRDPAANAGEPVAVLVTVDSRLRSVSKTHLAVGVDGRGLWLMDRASRNGTAVLDSAGRRTECPAWQRIYPGPGATVVCGDLRVTIERQVGH